MDEKDFRVARFTWRGFTAEPVKDPACTSDNDLVIQNDRPAPPMAGQSFHFFVSHFSGALG